MLNEPAAAMEPEGVVPTHETQLVSVAAEKPVAPNASTLSGWSPSQEEVCQRERLVSLQRQRCVGLWVACDDCLKYRYLPHVHDPLQLPEHWYCRMHPDAEYAQCTVEEATLSLEQEEDMVHGAYAAGSLVWACVEGFPRWPALVCDDPDTCRYYWLNGFSDIPTHYNVAFLEAEGRPAQRAWVSARHLHKYERTARGSAADVGTGRYRARFEAALQQANRALDMTVQERLETFSFVSRYRGALHPPSQFNNSELRQCGEESDHN